MYCCFIHIWCCLETAVAVRTLLNVREIRKKFVIQAKICLLMHRSRFRSEILPVSGVNCSVKRQIFNCRFPTKTCWHIPLGDGLHASFENSQHASWGLTVSFFSAAAEGDVCRGSQRARQTSPLHQAAVASSSPLLNASLIFFDSLALLIDACLLMQLPKANLGFRSIAYY